MAATCWILSILFLLFTPILANTEKTIFLGPEPITITQASHTLSGLRLDALGTANGTLRTQLTAKFPTADSPSGTATWLVLDKLTPRQRYEVRVCWPATQPTEFSLRTYPLATVWASPELLASLHNYSASRQSEAASPIYESPVPKDTASSSSSSSEDKQEEQVSVLLLRVVAAADYFTTDASLMAEVPPVDVDIILDPYLFNALPRSLAGTACYIVILAVVAYLLAEKTVSWMQRLIAASRAEQDTIGKKTQ
ncbi:hypothetical protein VTK56DRAFT_8714 [Thermocarpiscus australiensis]